MNAGRRLVVGSGLLRWRGLLDDLMYPSVFRDLIRNHIPFFSEIAHFATAVPDGKEPLAYLVLGQE